MRFSQQSERRSGMYFKTGHFPTSPRPSAESHTPLTPAVSESLSEMVCDSSADLCRTVGIKGDGREKRREKGETTALSLTPVVNGPTNTLYITLSLLSSEAFTTLTLYLNIYFNVFNSIISCRVKV